tara:strand:+ start:323 stop:667 length:345 start_codon:yes stop_codon:yes gene_type:complete
MFALLFASQTITAAFDSHSAHQEVDARQNLSHRNLDDSHKTHQEGALVATYETESSTQTQFDCHHCCHCHAPSGVYISANEKSNLVYKGNENVLAVKVELLSLWIAPEHRPPIV